jgi:predicted DNA-binding WGR domain protein
MAKEQFKRLHNTSSRNAFWEGWIEKTGHGWDFFYRYGAMGSSGTQRNKHFNGKFSAQAALNAKIFEKMKGDYYDATPAPKPVSKPVTFVSSQKAKDPANYKPAPKPKAPVVIPLPVEPEPEPEVAVDDFDFFAAILAG